MRTLLLLAYFFPPIGGAGVQRNMKLARYASEFGWKPIVVTGPGKPEGYWTPLDDSLLAELPANVPVHRIPTPEPRVSDGWHSRAERWIGLESPWERWWREGAVEVAHQVGTGADLVYASVAPYSTAPAALEIARTLGKPLVVDLEDPWAFDEMMVYPSAIHRRIERRRMRHALESATGVIMNTPEAASRVRSSFTGCAEEAVTSIANGYDAADFTSPVAALTSDKVRIVHAGSLHTEFALRHRRLKRLRRITGSAEADVDPLTRSHVYLMQAIRELQRENPALARVIELHLAGALTEADRDVIGDAEFVVAHGFLSHRETIDLIRSATLLFLPMHQVAEGHRVTIVPCKTYEYLASGRPILAAVPEGDARDLLTVAGNAYICRPSDVQAMKAAITDVARGEERGLPHDPPLASVVEPLERQRLTAEIAAFLDGVVGR